MATQNDGKGTFLANLAMSAFRGVVISNNGGITYSSNTGTIDAFTLEDAASGDYVAVKFFNADGTHKCELTGQPVTVADAIYLGALGRVSTTGTVQCGKSRTTSATNTEVIEFVSIMA
jgi:hypothetical protein